MEAEEEKESTEFSFTINDKTVDSEKLTELGEKFQNLDLAGGDAFAAIIVVAIILLFGGGMIFSLLFSIVEMIGWVLWGLIKHICWPVLKYIGWCLMGVYAYAADFVGHRQERQFNKTFDDALDTVLNKSEPKEVSKRKRKPIVGVKDLGDEFDGVDEFSEFK